MVRKGTQMNLIKWLACASLVVLSINGLGQTTYEPLLGRDKFACISYPAGGVMDVSEGSIELWIVNNFDPVIQLANKYYSPATYIQVSAPGQIKADWTFGARSVPGVRDVNCRVGNVFLFVKNTPESFAWKSVGERHHLVMTWKLEDNKYTVKLYHDGKLVPRGEITDVQQNPLLIGPGSRLCVGNPNYTGSFFSVSELRVSVVERTPEEIAVNFKTGPKGKDADSFTVLWDCFERIENQASVKSAPKTIPRLGPHGLIEGAFKKVTGDFGEVLQLHVINENLQAKGERK